MCNREKLLLEGFQMAREITRKYAKTFYFSSHFLPPEKKNAAYALYAACRMSDEAVDNNTQKTASQLNRAHQYIAQAYTQTLPHHPLLAVFQETVQHYKIPRIYFEELLEGMRMDMVKNRYADFSELYTYCYRVAGVVGLMMLCIFEDASEEAKKHAIELGIAMQLTNISRDIAEDLLRGRIYIPQDELERYGISELSLQEKPNPCLVNVLKLQIDRARTYYRKAEQGFTCIKNRRCRFVVNVMAELYEGILGSIEKNNYDVFSKRAYVPWFKKIIIALAQIRKKYDH